ncbi:cysteine hydrolase family protein [Amycolatopsis pigmentata]|uniref:Cysteine hydrolase family protein n=1 Tax=Amycolatopsis pigmentata TaxID=450801 RepID=A0ABW5FPL6_9PSEU
MAGTALLVMDIQNGIVGRFGEDSGYLPHLRRAIDAARAADLPVIFVRVGFRENYPEVSSRNKAFAAVAQYGGFTADALEIAPEVAPEPGEIVVTKRRVSAFTGSDLDVVLRAADVDTLVLTGISTSGVVLSTLRQAADLDFGITVLSDGCLDQDEEVHRVLVEKVFPRQADVITIDTWIEKL